MGLCPHGRDLKHKGCRRCEEVAEAENRREERLTRRDEKPKLAKRDRDETAKAPTADDERSYFDIDRMDLVSELDGQTRLYGEHAMRLADAKKAHAEAEAERKVTWAEVAMRVRTDPGAFGLKDKPSNDAVEEAAQLQDEYRQAVKAEIRAKHKVDVLQAAVSTIEHRKRVMEMQLELLVREFWAMPKMPQGGDDYSPPRRHSNVKA